MAKHRSSEEKDEKQEEHWMNTKWRPMMGWMYMLVCTMDFVGFPILWSLLQAMSHGQVNSQWQPLTLQGAGLFHIAMGAIIGVSAYGRTQEKLNGATTTPTTSASGMPTSFGAGAGTTYTPPPPIPQAAPTPVNVTVDVTPPAPAPVAATPAPAVDPDTQPHPDPTVDPTAPVRRKKIG
jgi:hypothetical protein